MESENNSAGSGGSGGRHRRTSQDFGPARRVKKRTEPNLHDVEAETALEDFITESDMAEVGLQHVDKPHRGKQDGSDIGSVEDEEDGPGTIQEEPTMSKAMAADIQLLRQKVDNFTQQVSGLLDAGKAYFLDASNAFEEGIVQLHQKVVERWEEEIEGLRNLDVLNEDISFRLGNARNVLGMLQVSASSGRHKGSESPEGL